jgi:putative holliday junction resolvase
LPRILAIDYGSKRTGLAVTDPMQMFATALTTVDTHKAIDFLKDYISKEPVELFVVGEAKNLDGTPAQSAPLITAFVNLLKKNFPGIPVEREDERFTSKMAFQTMIDSGISKSKRRDKKLVDKISAVLILQSYMERRGFEDLRI